MSDLISRQAAINSPVKMVAQGLDWVPVYHLEQLPSAERRGRWIEEYSANHFQAKCSACGESTLYGITYDLEGNAYYMNYCPNCGADMRGGQDG